MYLESHDPHISLEVGDHPGTSLTTKQGLNVLTILIMLTTSHSSCSRNNTHSYLTELRGMFDEHLTYERRFLRERTEPPPVLVYFHLACR